MIYDPVDVRISVSNKRQVWRGRRRGGHPDPPDPSPGSDTGYGCITTRILPRVQYTRDQKVRSPMQKIYPKIQEKDNTSFSKVRQKQILPKLHIQKE